MTYIELQAATHFSFLRGVSSAEQLFAAASLLGYPALGIADRNSVGGLVKALRAGDETGVRLVAGCRLDLMDGTALLVWPEDRAAWSRLTRLLTVGNGRADRSKGNEIARHHGQNKRRPKPRLCIKDMRAGHSHRGWTKARSQRHV